MAFGPNAQYAQASHSLTGVDTASTLDVKGREQLIHDSHGRSTHLNETWRRLNIGTPSIKVYENHIIADD